MNIDTVEGDRDTNGSKDGDQVHSIPHSSLKQPNDPSYSFDFIALLENNTRLQVIT